MSEAEVEQVVRRLASDVFDVPPATVGHSASPETIENWDSLGHLNFMLALEERFGIEINPDEIDAVQTIADAIDLVAGKGTCASS